MMIMIYIYIYIYSHLCTVNWLNSSLGPSPRLSQPGSNGKEGVLHIPQNQQN